jgi:hypothetical protein
MLAKETISHWAVRNFRSNLRHLPILGGLIFTHPARPLDPKSGKMAHKDLIDNSNYEH